MSASRHWSTASWAGAKRWCRTFLAWTRDRVFYDALWTGRRFVVQDTGGWEPDAKGLQQLVAEQAAIAMRTADAVVLVVDAPSVPPPQTRPPPGSCCARVSSFLGREQG